MPDQEPDIVHDRPLPREYKKCRCKEGEDCCTQRPENEDGKRWCKSEERPGCKNSSDSGSVWKCGCYLFKADRTKPGEAWIYVAGPDSKVNAILEPDMEYECICVKERH